MTLFFILLTLSYLILFEISFNTHRFFEPNFLEQYLQHHIFQHTIVFIAIFSDMWMAFQRTPVSKKTMLFSYVLGVIFEAFFVGSGLGGIISGLLWIWILLINWVFTRSLFSKLQRQGENVYEFERQTNKQVIC